MELHGPLTSRDPKPDGIHCFHGPDLMVDFSIKVSEFLSCAKLYKLSLSPGDDLPIYSINEDQGGTVHLNLNHN